MNHSQKLNSKKTTPSTAESTLQVGYWVAMGVAEGMAPMRCYVGQIEAIDDRGVRLTTIDWITGMASSWDLFVPWAYVQTVLIATPEHSLSIFGDAAGEWQIQMNGLSKNQCEAAGAAMKAYQDRMRESKNRVKNVIKDGEHSQRKDSK